MDTPQPASAALGLPDLEISYLKLLKSLRAAGQYGTSDLPVVRRIATWIDSEPVLHYICLNRRWYDDWEVKEALVRNERSPEEWRGPLETQVAIFDLLREMDASQLSEDERREMREDVRSLIKTLGDADRQVVRRRAYELSSSRRDGEPAPPEQAPAETPASPPAETPLPSAAPPVIDLATESEISPELEAQLEARVVEESQRRRAEAEALFEEDNGEAAAVLPAAPEQDEVPPVPEKAQEPMGDATVSLLRSEIGELPDLPPLAPQSKGATPAATETPPEDAVSEAERELELAREMEDPQLLQVLAGGPREEVHLALLDNPRLPESAAVMIARKATPRVANALYHQRRLFQRPRVQQALLKSPSAPSAALLEIVNNVGDLRGLLSIVSSPRVRHMEVKAKARARLGNVFRAMSQGEKVVAVRRSGRPLLKQLWSDFFRDEQLVLRCLKEKQLDEGTVLEISRSKIAPRRALEVIGNTAMWTANYHVRLALVSNPKTPRQVATRLVRKLSPADRRMIQRNPAVAEAIRRMA